MTTIFLSYARGDDEPFVRTLYDDLKAHGFKVWFDRVSMPSRNLTFHQEIRDAVAAHDRLLLVIGPKAVASEYVRQEWQFAWFEAEKVVTPILRLGDYPLAIDELKLVHAEDFRNDADYALHLKELIRILNEPPPPMGKLIAVPSLPAHYLSRTDRLIPLRDAVRSGLDSPASFGGMTARQQFHGIAGAAKHVGMHGMGGIGKSVLANLLARDRKIREAFPDGIVWVGLGSVPVVADLMRRVHADFGGDGAFVTEHEGKAKLKELLSDKAVLLVLDDAWRRQDIEAFDILGPRCRALITTRDAGLLTSVGGMQHLVELLTDDEALRLLALAVGKEPDELPAEARMVIKQCGRLPLAVSLAGGMVAAGMSWTNLLTAFDRHKLEFFKDEHRPEQHQSLWKMIEMSVRALDAAEQMRLVELGVFPEDEAVPEKAVATLWQHTGQLDDLDTPELLVKLKQRSLVQFSPGEQGGVEIGRVSLHDLVHDYCLRRAQVEFGKPECLHDLLLAAYRQPVPRGWWTGPNDGYFHSHLRNHLVAAGRRNELADLLLELPWLEAKNAVGLVFDLVRDFKAATNALPNTDDRQRILMLLDEALRRDIHFIARHAHDYPQGLFQCLWNTCWWYDCPTGSQHYVGGRTPGQDTDMGLHRLLERWRGEKDRAKSGFLWVRQLRPPAVHLGTGLQAVFHGHEGVVNSVSFSPDGSFIISGSNDRSVRVWDTDNGETVGLLEGHEREVNDVCFSPDGRFIVSGSNDGTIRLWEVAGYHQVFSIHNQAPISSVACSPDGRHIVSGSDDTYVRVWDISSSSRQPVCLFQCSTIQSGSAQGINWVRSVGFSPDGNCIVSVSHGHLGRDTHIWDWRGKKLLLGLYTNARCAAFSADGHHILTLESLREGVQFREVETGEHFCTVGTQKFGVTSMAVSPDGSRIAIGDSDGIVQIWDVSSGEQLCCLRGLESDVNCVSFSPDGRLIVSGFRNGTVRLWAVGPNAQLLQQQGHEGPVRSLSFSTDGNRLVTGSDDGTARVWETDSGCQLFCLVGTKTYGSSLISVSFSADGRRVAAISHQETLRVWDANAGTELLCVLGEADRHGWAIQDEWEARISFSADGQRIVSALSDGTTRVWNSATGACLTAHKTDEAVNTVTTNSRQFPCRTSPCGPDTVIEDADTGLPCAWWPIALYDIATHPSGRIWAAAVRNYLCLFKLEGEG